MYKDNIQYIFYYIIFVYHKFAIINSIKPTLIYRPANQLIFASLIYFKYLVFFDCSCNLTTNKWTKL